MLEYVGVVTAIILLYNRKLICNTCKIMREAYKSRKQIASFIGKYATTEHPDVEYDKFSMIISYECNGSKYNVALPYSADMMIHMCEIEVMLFYDEHTYQDITLEPGVAYTSSAHDLGGDHIIAYNHATGKSHEYINSKPMWCTEII